MQKINIKKTNIQFEFYDGDNIDYPNNSFDVIISYQVIEHIENVQKYLKNIKKLLKPNGFFIITTPNRSYRLTNTQKPWNKFHLREYSSSSLYEEIKSEFSNIKIYSISASKEILDIEFQRVLKNKEDYDPQKEIKIDTSINFKSKYSIKDFYITDINLDTGLDLLITNKTLL